MSLKQKTTIALIWTLIDKVGTQIAYFITGVILADLLPVSDFGLVGMLSIFIFLSTIFIDGGFSSALIRKQNTTESDYSTVFYLNLGVSILLYLLLYFSAPWIAAYYKQPALIPIARVIFLSLIFNSAGIIQNALYAKSINFRIQTLTNIVSLIFSGGIALLLAWKGFGAWAIVYQTVSLSIIKTGLLWIVSSWRPRLVFDMECVKSLFGFSSYLLLSQLIGSVQSIYPMVLGRHFNVNAVGFYTQAQKMSDMAISTLNTPIQSALYPVLSSINEEPERLNNAFRKTIHFACFISFLFLPMLAITARPFLLIILGDKWSNSIVFLQILSICGIFSIITSLVNNFLRVIGNSKGLVFVETTKAIIVFALLMVTLPYGVFYVVLSQLISRFVICIFSMYYTARKTDYSMKMQIEDVMPYLVLSGITTLLVLSMELLTTNIWILFFVQNVLYVIIYLGLSYKKDNRILKDVIQLIKTKRNG